MCAQKIQSEPEDKLCRTWFLGGFLAYHTLGSASTETTRSVCGTLFPLWAILTVILFVVELVVRLVLAVLILVLFILSLVLCWPCYIIVLCIKCKK